MPSSIVFPILARLVGGSTMTMMTTTTTTVIIPTVVGPHPVLLVVNDDMRVGFPDVHVLHIEFEIRIIIGGSEASPSGSGSGPRDSVGRQRWSFIVYPPGPSRVLGDPLHVRPR
jgi:hypothetical protein